MTMGHTTGGTPPLSDLPAPPPRTTVVVHWGPLAAGAPVPHDRRVLRWILDRAHESTVWMASIEPTIGSTVTPELDRAAVVTVATGVRTRQWLVEHRANIEVVVCTDTEVLALIAGGSYDEIAKEFHTARPTISRWKKRFQKEGIEGLSAGYRGRVRNRTTRSRVARCMG